MIEKQLQRIFGLHRLDAVFHAAKAHRSECSIYGALTKVLGLRVELDPHDLDRVPSTGPVIVVANHPSGAADGIVLADALERVRKDVKILSHVWFGRYPALAERMFLINPQAKAERRAGNARTLKAAKQWLADGHVLVVFPAGSVARFRWDEQGITDAPWQTGLVRLLHKTHATVLPVHLAARNGVLYYLLSLVHVRLGALMLGWELLNKGNRTIRMRLGRPIPYDTLKNRRRSDWLVKSLRLTTYRLERRSLSAP